MIRNLKLCHYVPTAKEKGTRRSASPGKTLPLRLYDLQVVGHRECARHAVGADAGEILVAIVVDDALEGHVAVVDDDADRLLHSQFILLQRSVLIDGAEQPAA